jgi:hypothetical protein
MGLHGLLQGYFFTTLTVYIKTPPATLLLLRVFVAAETCLPSSCLATIGGYTYTQRLMGGIYEVCLLRLAQVPWYTYEVSSGLIWEFRSWYGDTQIHRQTARWSHKPLLFCFFQNKESWLKMRYIPTRYARDNTETRYLDPQRRQITNKDRIAENVTHACHFVWDAACSLTINNSSYKKSIVVNNPIVRLD